MLNDTYFLLTLFLMILIVYLILPIPKIIFRINNKNINIKESDCN